MKEKKKLSLPAWIFIGMLAGIVAGLIFAFAGLGDFTTEWIKPVGTIYVNLLKFLVVPVVLFSIADGVISLKDLKRVGSVGVKTFIYYMITTALAVVIGLILVNIFKGNFTPLPSADHREQDDRDDQELQQVDVDRADRLDPLRGKIAETGERKNETGDDTGQHADEYPRRQAKFFLFFHTFLLLSKITDKDQ